MPDPDLLQASAWRVQSLNNMPQGECAGFWVGAGVASFLCRAGFAPVKLREARPSILICDATPRGQMVLIRQAPVDRSVCCRNSRALAQLVTALASQPAAGTTGPGPKHAGMRSCRLCT